MKTQYLKKTDVESNTFLRIALKSLIPSAGEPKGMVWDDLRLLKVMVQSQGVSGVRLLDNDTTKKIYYFFDDDERMNISLESLAIGVQYRITVVVAYGTETRAQYIFDIERAPIFSPIPIYIDATLIAVETIGDGKGDAFDPTEMEIEIAGKADGSIYRVGDDDEAVIRSHGFSVVTGTQPQFAIDTYGNLVLYNEGTPVVLTPAKLAELIS